MKKILPIFIIIIISLLAVPAFAKDETILVVVENEQEEIMMKEILNAMDKEADFLSISNYSSSVLESYDYVILFTEAPLIDILERKIRVFCVGDNFFSIPGIETKSVDNIYNFEISFDKFEENVVFDEKIKLISHNYYTNYRVYGYIKLDEQEEYPFGIITNNILYAPYLNENNMSVFAFSGMLKEYLGDTKCYETYIKFNEVYGFSDNNQIENVSNIFYEQGIPYILGVMPQLENIDYPAYVRFIETISYCQSRNASIVVENPLSGNIENEKYKENMDNLSQYGILILDNNINAYSAKYDIVSNIISTDKKSNLPMNVIIDYNLFDDWDRVDEICKKVRESGLVISSYRKNFSNDSFSSIDIEVDKEFNFKEKTEIKTEFDHFFNQSNRVLTIIVLSGIIIILILIVIGRYIYRMKFYKKD